ncbi:unnamed protein product [Meloidogyne enterolobii]|uniref:Uncharacterized protein n=1 Tax=Meloidogyne enterolobii TaxID=390850 RepID=A0ACB1AV89_MELEN
MQNLAASANLQLFSKALQETAQQPNDTSEHKQQQQQNPVISAADLQHYMFPHLENHLDQASFKKIFFIFFRSFLFLFLNS